MKSYTPPWPLPKIFRMTKGGKIVDGIFEGETINTPSMVAVEDYLDALTWAESVGGLKGLIERSNDNLHALEDWIKSCGWAGFLAKDAAIRSNTSVCLKITDPWFAALSDDAKAEAAKKVASPSGQGRRGPGHRRLSRRAARASHLVRRHGGPRRSRSPDALARLGLGPGEGLTNNFRGNAMPFIPENELERALVKAAKNPVSGPDFYRLLLETDLLVLGTALGQENATEKFRVAPGGQVNLVTGLRNAQTFLPVFSSLLRMQEYVKKETRYLSINGRALLELTRGAPVILNPASEYGKEFTPREIAYLLDPSALRGAPRTIIGEAEYPIPLVESLTEVFAARPDIEAAWMIQVTLADRDERIRWSAWKPTGDWQSLLHAVQEAARKSVPADMVFDVSALTAPIPPA